jgi:cysteine sulfinate desulfinase/cysteine desulfurase-like protein
MFPNPAEDTCTSGAAEDMAHSSLRFGIGRFTTEAEIDFVVKHIVRTVTKLRDMRFGLEYLI